MYVKPSPGNVPVSRWVDGKVVVRRDGQLEAVMRIVRRRRAGHDAGEGRVVVQERHGRLQHVLEVGDPAKLVNEQIPAVADALRIGREHHGAAVGGAGVVHPRFEFVVLEDIGGVLEGQAVDVGLHPLGSNGFSPGVEHLLPDGGLFKEELAAQPEVCGKVGVEVAGVLHVQPHGARGHGETFPGAPGPAPHLQADVVAPKGRLGPGPQLDERVSHWPAAPQT